MCIIKLRIQGKMHKSNLKYKSNLYVLKEDFRHNDKEFFSKIDDPDLLYFYKYRKQLDTHCFSEMQKRIVAERSICSNLKYPDPCWGKKGDDYICKCVNIDCKELDNCRKNIPLEDEEYKNFAPEKNVPIDYEYTGVAKDIFYYPVKTSFADEYDSYNPIEIPYEEYEQTVNTDKNSVIWDDSPELVNVQEESAKEIEEYNYANENEPEDEILDISFEQQAGEFRIVEQEEIIKASIDKGFLVNAGPGVGKTYTLIQKINDLVTNQDADPEGIVVLSFTNAVVNEIKTRLKDFVRAGGKRSLNNVDICTFNSFAGRINYYEYDSNEDNNKKYHRSSSYTESVIQAAEFLKNNPDILEGNKYFLIDEIQDLTNSLAYFVLEILKACKKQKISFTLFGDTCQAIYDFEDDTVTNIKMTSSNFYSAAKEMFEAKDLVELRNINHRQTEKLANLTSDYRKEILNDNKSELKYVLRDISNDIAKRPLNEICIAIESCTDNQKFAILTSNNGQALNYASALRKKKVNFTINPSGENDRRSFTYAPWIASVFYGYEKENMYFDDFVQIVQNKKIQLYDANNKEIGKDYIEVFWDSLTKSSNVLNIKDFLEKLYIKSKEIDSKTVMYLPKPSLLEVSTIHKAKGREFDQVAVDMNFYKFITGSSERIYKPEGDPYQHRKMYVALTRPKKNISLLLEPETLEKVGYKKNKKIWYKGPEMHPVAIGILEKYISYDEFSDDYEIVRQKIKNNTEIRLTRSSKDNFYHIECKINRNWIDIGKMTSELTDSVKDLLHHKKNNLTLPVISKLYVNKKFTYLRRNKDKNGTITPVTGISFTGFGEF